MMRILLGSILVALERILIKLYRSKADEKRAENEMEDGRRQFYEELYLPNIANIALKRMGAAVGL